jgi:hypothetical protein
LDEGGGLGIETGDCESEKGFNDKIEKIELTTWVKDSKLLVSASREKIE